MKLLRELVYEDKPSRYDFGINDKGSLNNRIYNEWLLLRKELDPEDRFFYSKITRILNDTYYVCTLVLIWPEKETNLNYFKNRIKHPNIVYPLVYFYLSMLEERAENTNRVLIMIENMMNKNPDMQEKNEDLQKIGKNWKGNIAPSQFDKRELNADFLSSINWSEVTEGYNPVEIKRAVSIIARNGDECKMMAEAILKAAHESEDEFYNPSPDHYENDDDQYYEPDNDPNDLYLGPDYSEAYRLCEEIISNTGASIKLINKREEKKKGRIPIPDQDENYAIKRRLKDLLNADWFDEYSTDKDKYTVEWREELVNDLMKTEYKDEIVDMWKTKDGRKRNNKNLVKCSLLGSLLEVGVIKAQKSELASKLDISSIKDNSLADYLGSKKRAPYLEWLRNYVNTNNNDPFSD